jgi:hypothetical protein
MLIYLMSLEASLHQIDKSVTYFQQSRKHSGSHTAMCAQYPVFVLQI